MEPETYEKDNSESSWILSEDDKLTIMQLSNYSNEQDREKANDDMALISESLKNIYTAISIESDTAVMSDHNKKIIKEMIKNMNQQMLTNYSKKCRNVKLLLETLAKEPTGGSCRRVRRRTTRRQRRTKKKRGSRKK